MNDEEPKALGICLEYYYSLDYATSVIEEETPEEAAPVAAPDDEDTAILAPPPREPAEWIPAKVDEAPSFGGQRPLTPESLRDDAKAEPLEEEHAPTAALDESSPLSPAKKKNKKKKKKASQAVSGDSEAASAEPDGAAAVEQNPKPEPVQDSEPAQAEPEPAPVNYTTLSLHAAIYNLSKKLGTPSLSSLSLAKFRQAAGEKKGAPEFLQVTRDIYTAKSITPSGEEDRSLKDVIVDTLFEDQSLLDRKETQDAIKDLSLGFDLIMKMRRHLAAVDTWR